MIDPFARAKAMHTQPAGAPAPASPAAPMTAGPTMAKAVPPQMNFMTMSKQMGLGHLKLDKNPALARSQLTAHLAKQFGPDYMQNPQVAKLMEAFNQHSTVSPSDLSGMSTTAGEQNLKAILG